ncbi:hypothetical protein [Nonomuraea gerenzanensis]|uniref:Uncharacterized protein n=1 Tax=Nonomuraea gerenzanensis TaxID=93944 RepID=A0A1M4BL19_9ACTN|nr:hypothetical protein [Nonomuraea gerenzanensis]UBU19185.1 hypothetical protein LCN96_56295 [Nonomuraea gerenzanensis]SAP16366.1 hypothetical protein BN4615_P11029 [Nonomuraea gerenzanensis]
MTTTPHAQNPSPAEQAKALLANAAHSDNFYDSFGAHTPRLHKQDAATATYETQAATAHAMLGVVDELGELRSEVRQAVGAPREDLFQLASALRGLAAALTTFAERDADVADAIRALTGTLAERMDAQTDQVQAVRDEVEEGLAGVAGGVELLADRRRSRWRSRLPWRRHRTGAQPRPSITEVREALMGTAAAKAITATGEKALGLLAGLDAAGQDTTRPLVLAGGAPAHQAWCVINQLAAQGRFLPEGLREHWSVRPAQQQLEETLQRVLTTGLTAAAAVADLREAVTGLTAAVEVAAVCDERGLQPPALRRPDAAPSLPPLDTGTVLPVVPAIAAGQDALERLAHLREVLADWAVTLPDHPNRSGLRQGLAATVDETWEATHAVIAKVAGSSVSTPVQDAVLLLAAALQEMGPAGVPSMEAVRAVSDRLTELLKVVAAESVAARAEVDAR